MTNLSIEIVNREDHQLTYLFKLKDTGIGMDRDSDHTIIQTVQPG